MCYNPCTCHCIAQYLEVNESNHALKKLCALFLHKTQFTLNIAQYILFMGPIKWTFESVYFYVVDLAIFCLKEIMIKSKIS